MRVHDGYVIGNIRHIDALETTAWFLFGDSHRVGFSSKTKNTGTKPAAQRINQIGVDTGNVVKIKRPKPLVNLPKVS